MKSEIPLKWIQSIPELIKNDQVWRVEAYKLSLYLSDLVWYDTELIIKSRRFSLADQLYRSVSSISANIAEGYSRRSLKEKANFYGYSLGSAREAKDWYYKSRKVLGEKAVMDRLKLLNSVIKLLQVMISDLRNRSS